MGNYTFANPNKFGRPDFEVLEPLAPGTIRTREPHAITDHRIKELKNRTENGTLQYNLELLRSIQAQKRDAPKDIAHFYDRPASIVQKAINQKIMEQSRNLRDAKLQ